MGPGSVTTILGSLATLDFLAGQPCGRVGIDCAPAGHAPACPRRVPGLASRGWHADLPRLARLASPGMAARHGWQGWHVWHGWQCVPLAIPAPGMAGKGLAGWQWLGSLGWLACLARLAVGGEKWAFHPLSACPLAMPACPYLPIANICCQLLKYVK